MPRRRGEEPRIGFLFFVLAIGAGVMTAKIVSSVRSAIKGT